MSNYPQDIIKQVDLRPIDLQQTIRFWNLPDFQVKSGHLPENATAHKTFIMMTSEGNWHAGVEWTVNGHSGSYATSIIKCSTLQRLLDQFSEYFELN